MQSKNIADAGKLATRSPADLSGTDRTRVGSRARRAARRLEIDRDHRLVIRGLAREVSRAFADEADGHPEILIERVEAALAVSRADCQRLNNTRINLRGNRCSQFQDSMSLPAALAVYGHRGNYHGARASMEALGSLLAPLMGLPEGDTKRFTAASLAEALHRRCEIWTLEMGGVVHVFARPGSEADRALAGAATRMSRAPAWPPRTPLTIV